jgi:hypothetical protein
MPSLDDLGTKQVISGTPDPEDIIPYFDISEFGNAPVKKTTVSALLAGAETGPIVSADITDATADGRSNPAKVLKTETVGIGRTRLSLGDLRLNDGFGTQVDLVGSGVTMTAPGPVVSSMSYPTASGFLSVLRGFVDSAAADAVVSIGDAWWDTTLNKARVRLS